MVQLLLMLVLAVSAVGGTVGAADQAVPGDALYGLDRAMEQVSLDRVRYDVDRAELEEGLINERLEEAAILLQDDDGLAKKPKPSATPDPLETPDPSETPDPEKYTCTGANPHPRATDLAEYYAVDYETVMTWFCEGNFGFGEIMHALEASQQTGLTPEEILAKRVDQGWGQIWQELGLKGKPNKQADVPLDPTAVPPTEEPATTDQLLVPGADTGKPEDKGKPENPGKSEDKDKGKPEKLDKTKNMGKPAKPPKPPKVK
jgi:hypothetical protein